MYTGWQRHIGCLKLQVTTKRANAPRPKKIDSTLITQTQTRQRTLRSEVTGLRLWSVGSI